MNTDAFIESILDRIEEQEARLLVWGLTDASISREELANIINPLLDDALEQGFEEFYDTGSVVEALIERGLVFPTVAGTYQGYRSRMAETVRLLFHLRQLFPKYEGRDGWQQGRTLVSDFRFSRRRRKYPGRNIDPTSVIDSIEKEVSSGATKRALRTMLLSRGETFSLAEFQVRATERIVTSLEERKYSGTLVSAGTGSGKTLAFYIPALARIAGHHLNAQSLDRNWVKCLALYPRTELLKDQFSEIYREARRLDGLLSEVGKKIRIGALFSATPFRPQDLLKRKIAGWEQKGAGFRCGFMACPTPGCSGDLIWPESDIKRNFERLVCTQCRSEIAGDEVTLTRQALQKNPPDILFTTTEMLNQRMSDSWSRHLFGLRPEASHSPEMMLLDEVHTYSGFHGAQVAYLLRRWIHLVQAPITFVGLSATLRDGNRFFARLTGLYESQVKEVVPRRNEMVSEGAEYLLALKGDPVSKTALLSTTIQTIMLLSRMLDSEASAKSDGIFGTRIFAFTDDMDATNRLYFGMLDAEGRNSSGDPDMARHPKGGLAYLRTPTPSTSRERHGQNWSAPETIGHVLTDRKEIGRTSSQDPGVIANLDVVVATASLEVGFNDPSVGAVVQHKAPRGVAAYLQRKGRAGRLRKMRPWTVLVLSDYGRDRQAYQAYDRLFDPELEIQAIPLASRYIQHVQGVYSLIDYLGIELIRVLDKGSIWLDLAGPSEKNERRKILSERLSQILRDDGEREALLEFVQKSLRISEIDIQAVLWEYPRPLLTTVIPTALRRVSTNWRRHGIAKDDFRIRNSPLPEFAPASLFNELNLPEVRINLPPDWDDAPARQPEALPIGQAMRTFAPGRVSRRYGVKHALVRHWVAPETLKDSSHQDFSLEGIFSGELLGEWQALENGAVESIPALRPYEINPVQPPRSVLDTSNAQLIWRSQFVRRVAGNGLTPPKRSPWENIVVGLEAHTHGLQNPIEVRRFAIGARAEIQRRRKDEIRTQFEFRLQNRPASLGFSLSVDAVCFRLAMPVDLDKESDGQGAEKWQSLRTARFQSLILEGDGLPNVSNQFLRQWLGSIYLSALTHEALQKKISLVEAAANLEEGTAEISPAKVVSAIFQSPVIGEDEDQVEDETVVGRDQLREELNLLLTTTEVLEQLRMTAEVLWSPIDASWRGWLARRFKTTVAAAAFSAIGNLCPDMEVDGLVVDIDPGPRSSEDVDSASDQMKEIWISETAPGGTGHIQEFMIRYAEDPRRFYSLLTASLMQSEYQLVDFQLRSLLQTVAGETKNLDLVKVVDEFRNSQSAQETEDRFAALRHELRRHNFVLFHSFSTALTSRILRVGSSSETDDFLLRVTNYWEVEEKRLGVELDPRTVAYFFCRGNGVDGMLRNAGFSLPDQPSEVWRFNVIYGMLWPRGSANRKHGLDLYNQFCTLPDAEPLLVTELLVNRADKIPVDSSNWKECAIEALSLAGVVTLVGDIARSQELATAVNFFATNPITSEYLSVFARLEAVRRVGPIIEVDLELAEVAQ